MKAGSTSGSGTGTGSGTGSGSGSGSSTESLKTDQKLGPGDTGVQVRALQARLKDLGYYTSTIDGEYGGSHLVSEVVNHPRALTIIRGK